MLFRFENISYDLGSTKIRRVHTSGELAEGKTLIIQGASGVGKSTLLRILACLQEPSTGECFLNGVYWKSFAPHIWRRRIHYLSQQPIIFDGTVKDNLELPFQNKLMYLEQHKLDLQKAQYILQQLLLPEEILKQDAKTLSGGEMARIAFARALLINPQILLLDEPTASLDDTARQALYKVLGDWLKLTGHGAMLISHIEDYLTLDNISFLKISS